jgi:L-ascorbate metabolism protein UlaG (beta-lactamase superfamily)
MDPVRKIREELYAPGGPDGIWWLGNAGFAIRLDSHYIFLDPCVTEWPDSPYASSGKQVGTTKVRLHEFPLEADDFERADLVLYTHDHSDHLDRGLLPRLVGLKPEIWAPEQCVQSILEEGVPKEQVHVARVGGSLRKDNYAVEFIRARHASAGGSCDLDLKWYYQDVQDQDAVSCGYLMKTRYGNIYHPGDTYYLQEFSKLEVDYLLLPVNDTNLGVGFAALLTSELKPRVVIPCHYGMYHPPSFWRGGHPAEYLAVLVSRGYWASLPCTDIVTLRPGGKFLLG